MREQGEQPARQLPRPQPSRAMDDAEAYRHYFNDNAAGAFRAFANGTLVEVNAALARLLGYGSAGELKGMPLSRCFAPSSRATRLLAAVRDQGSVPPQEARLRRRDGSVLVALVGASRAGAELGRSVLCGTVVDITAHKRTEATLRRKAYRDALTGLVNRRFLEQHAERCLAVAERKGHDLGVVYADLVGFKDINDTYGHAAGDAALSELAERLQEESRAGDVVCRVGGDEFVVLLPEVDGLRAAVDVARRLAGGLALPVITDRVSLTVTANFGVAVYPRHGDAFDELVEAADRAMYRAKAMGVTVEAARGEDA